MLFSAGNLLTLGIVLVILAVFRQLDRNNRSIEKVKKFGDKLKDDLAAFTDERAAKLSDFSIELDVKQKAAKELLNRIQSIETSLNARAGAIAQIDTRISEYDKALDELLKMTEKADENLKRIHEESKFADTVARKVREAQGSLNAIMKDLGTTEARFAKENTAALEAARGKVMEEASKKTEAVSLHIVDAIRRIKEHEEHLAFLERSRKEKAQTELADLKKILDQGFEKARHEAEKLEDAVFAKLKESIEERAKKLQNALEEKYLLLQQSAREKVLETQGLVKGFKAEWQKESEEMQISLRSEVSDRSEMLASRIDDAENRVTKAERLYEERYEIVESKALEIAESVTAKVKNAIERYKSEATAKVQEFRTQAQGFVTESKNLLTENERNSMERIEILSASLLGLEGRFKETQARIGAESAEIEKSVFEKVAKETENTANELASKLTGQLKAFDEEISKKGDLVFSNVEVLERKSLEFEQKLVNSLSSLDERLSRETAGVQSKVLAGLEKQLSEYQGEVNYKFKKLEDVNVDIGRMEASLRSAMAKIEERIGSEFAVFGESLSEKQKAEEAKIGLDMESLRKTVVELEEGINELKGRAYANVSEKLKVFEDDFFSDLQKRTNEANEKLDAWKAELSGELGKLADEAKAERSGIERKYGEGLKTGLAEVQAKGFDQLEKLQEQISSYQETVKERMSQSEESLVVFQNGIRQDIQDVQKAAQSAFQGEFGRYGMSVADQLKKSERDIEIRLKRLDDLVEGGKSEAEAVFERIRSDLNLWQEKSLKQIKESESLATESTARIRDEFTRQRDDLIAKTQSEREELRRELSALDSGMESLRKELTQKGKEAIEQVSKSYDSLLSETQGKAKEIEAGIEGKTRELRLAAQEIREKVESSQTKLFGKVEDEAKLLSLSLDEIDKREKAFVAQTKIFERADELKDQLAANIEDLKGEIAKVESRRAEAADLEAQFSKIKRLEDEVSQKMARFLAEKRRIEAMEEDFKKLLSISQSVDAKLEQVTTSDDALTQIQERVMRLTEIASEAEMKYERLEKKSNIIDSTTAAVEKNFQSLQVLEKSVKGAEDQVRAIPDKLSELKRSVDSISENKTEIERAVKKLSELEDLLKSTEEKIESVQKAREWIARTETRLEEISRQAKDQVKVLGDIMKSETQGAKKDKGAPPLSVRETVAKLSRQGWTVEEISRATKISRGEVELILELNPRGQ